MLENNEASIFPENPGDRQLLYERFMLSDEILQEVESTLRRAIRTTINDRTVWTKDKTAKPIMNERGIATVLMMIRSFLNRATTVSNYSEQRINKVLMNFLFMVTDHLFEKYRQYDLEPSDFDFVSELIGQYCEAAIRRSINRAEARDLLGGEKRVLMHQIGDNQGNQSASASIFPSQ